MQRAREHVVFNQVVSGESIEVKAGEVIGHLSYHERPEVGSQYFCHLEVFSQDPRMGDFLANKAGVTSGAAELHTLAGKILWKYNEDRAAFEVAGVGGVSLFSKAERLTPESECQSKESNGKTWYQIPAESAWMSAVDVEKVNQFDLEKRGFIRLEQNEEPRSFFQTAKEGWLRQAFGRLEKLTRSDASDTYSSGEAESYKKLLQQMDMNQDGLIETNELWRYLHNHQPDIQHQVQRLVMKHHSEWLKDGMSALWQAALDEQRKSYPELALYNQEYINKLVWMKEVPEIRSNEALWHMHPVVFLDALCPQSECACNRDITLSELKNISSRISDENARKYIQPINTAFSTYGVNSCLVKAHMLAQMLHESGRFSTTKEDEGENASYSPWYGRGLIQITLRENYVAYGLYSNEDVASSENNRNKLLTIPHSVTSALWFLKIHTNCYDYSLLDDFNKTSHVINGGFIGYNDRLKLINSAIKSLHAEHMMKLNHNGEYTFLDSDVYNSKRGTLAWGLWHDPGTSKDGMTKNQSQALVGYKRFRTILSTNPFTQSELNRKWYGIRVIDLEEYVNQRINQLEA